MYIKHTYLELKVDKHFTICIKFKINDYMYINKNLLLVLFTISINFATFFSFIIQIFKSILKHTFHDYVLQDLTKFKYKYTNKRCTYIKHSYLELKVDQDFKMKKY